MAQNEKEARSFSDAQNAATHSENTRRPQISKERFSTAHQERRNVICEGVVGSRSASTGTVVR